MLDPRELNARGVRVRQAFDVLGTLIVPRTMPQQAAEVLYARAAFSNLMREIEQDYGVAPGYFGSSGAELPEINPFSGVAMPAPLSNEPPPPIIAPSRAPLNPPTPTPDQPLPTV